jgi:dihydroorotate dehydrogenase (fumarate)
MSADLSSRYLGLQLAHPIVASCSPLTGRPHTLELLEQGGAAAVVLPSLFEEDIVDSAFAEFQSVSHGLGATAEASTYLPPMDDVAGPAERYLELIAEAKSRLDIPVIASLNGVTTAGWLRYAADIASAGADALELNVYVVAADRGDTSANVEEMVVDFVRHVASRTALPVSVKLSPFFSALPSVASQLVFAGAQGLVLFNRFYQPDIDLEHLAVVPSLELSTSSDLRLPLRWTGILHGQVPCSLAVSGGIHTSDDVVKALLVGANATMTTSALLQHGPGHLGVLVSGLAQWLDENGYDSVAQMQGSMSQRSVRNPDGFERANYRSVIRRGMERWAY